MNLKYPIYIISKGRWESRLTSKALENMNMPYHIVIEPQEYNEYAKVINPKKILKLPFSNLGQGSIPVRNWVWEYSISIGAERHWILDDNIQWFARLYKNKKIKVLSGICFKVVEDFTDRYENIALSGLQYEMFTPAFQKCNVVIFNTRIYSCILIKNDLPHRWRGRYNEDTDLSLRILKDGWCTALIQAFICKKITTMQMKGGNTDILYQKDGRYKMALSLYRQHPEVVKIGKKWGRYQHVVNYRPFKKNKLIRRKDINWDDFEKNNEYGMKLETVNT